MKWFVGEEDEEERMQDDSSFILHPSSFIVQDGGPR